MEPQYSHMIHNSPYNQHQQAQQNHLGVKPPMVKAGSSPNLHLHMGNPQPSHFQPSHSSFNWSNNPSSNPQMQVHNGMVFNSSGPLFMGTPLGIPPNLRASTESNGGLSPSSSPGAIKRSRKNLEKTQVEILENAFMNERYPSKQAKELIAAQSGLDYNKVVKWFDNRRTKARKTSDAPRYEDNSPSMHLMSSPSSPEGAVSPTSSNSPMFPAYNSSSGNSYVLPNYNQTFSPGTSPSPQRKLSGSINAISAKMSNFSLAHDEEGRIRSRSAGALPLPTINTDSLNFGDSRMQLYNSNQPPPVRRIPRTLEENWDLCKDHRMYACEITHSRTSQELQDAASRNLEGWMMWMINKKKNKVKRMDYLGLHHQGIGSESLRKEVATLFNSLEYHHETMMWQGDNYWLNGTVHITTFSFKKNEGDVPSSLEKDHKGDEMQLRPDTVNVEAVYESRTVGRPISTSQATTNRIYFRIGTISGIYGKEDSFTVGVKAHGNQEESNGAPSIFEAWADLERLRQVLDTNLKQTELMAFLVFCSQFKADDTWFRNCMSQSMFGDEDTDYYAENDD